MSSIAIYEAELDGDSVIIWEAGKGQRVTFLNNKAAETSASFLIAKATEFHENKEKFGVISAYVYGEDMSSYEFIRVFIHKCRKMQYKIEEGYTRPPSEFW